MDPKKFDGIIRKLVKNCRFNEETGEEVFQLCYEKIWKIKDQLEVHAEADQYKIVKVSLRRAVIDMLRKEPPQSEPMIGYEEYAVYDCTPEDSLAQKELEKIVVNWAEAQSDREAIKHRIGLPSDYVGKRGPTRKAKDALRQILITSGYPVYE